MFASVQTLLYCSNAMHICRRHKLRQAIYTADDGEAPPLYSKASPALLWGSMYGTEHLDPSGLRKWKATAVRVITHEYMCVHLQF